MRLHSIIFLAPPGFVVFQTSVYAQRHDADTPHESARMRLGSSPSTPAMQPWSVDNGRRASTSLVTRGGAA
jgi:hypothetical protein